MLRPQQLICTISALLLTSALCAAPPESETKATKGNKARAHWHEHYKVYGFARNYISFDSRETVTTVAGLFSYIPKDELWNVTPAQATAEGIERHDLNASPNVRFLSISTRVGLDINYLLEKTHIGGKIEADFCAGVTGNGGTALFRMRHAYITLGWDSLSNKRNTNVKMLIGQTWHPLTEDMPDVISLNSGAPFNAFNRSPQLRISTSASGITATVAALWQMQYMSNGPSGTSTEYINHSCTPEIYAGISYNTHGVTMKGGVDVLSICPRQKGQITGTDGTTALDVKVKERLTTVSPYLFAEYKHGLLRLAAKTIYAQAGEHLNLSGGYGVAEQRPDGSRRYTPTRSSSTWLSISYGDRLKGSIMAGYAQLFGTKDQVTGDTYFCGNSFKNVNRLWRVQPSITWSIGKYFVLGAEYELTSVQYGTFGKNDTHALATNDLHRVMNHRVQLMTMLKF